MSKKNCFGYSYKINLAVLLFTALFINKIQGNVIETHRTSYNCRHSQFYVVLTTISGLR